MPSEPTPDFDEEIDRRNVPALKQHQIVLGADGLDLFPAGVADMDFRVADCVTQAMQNRVAHGIFGYETVPDGLIQAVTGWLQRRHDWSVPAAHILRAPNVLNAISMAVCRFTAPGAGVIVQPPVFFDFYDILQENGRQIICNPLLLTNGRYTMDFDGLERCAQDPNVSMLVLCNPHNPVGRVWTSDELRRLGEICARNNVLVVSDEIHADLVFQGHRFTPFASLGPDFAANSITCISPAKSFNIAACCSAFTVVPDDARRAALKAENSRLTVNKNNAFSSVAMEAAYSQGAPWLDAALAYIESNLNLVRNRLTPIPKVSLIEPEGTFLVWLDFRALDLTPDALTDFLRQKAGWAVTRGQAFGPEGIGFARLNIACTRVNLERALSSLETALN